MINIGWKRNVRMLLVVVGCVFIGLAPSARADVDSPLDYAGLKSMLETMGYEINENTFESGLPYCVVHEKYQGITYKITAYVSSDGEVVWIYAGFGNVPDDKQIPHDIAIKMLHVNFDSIYVDFAMSPRTGYLQLEGALNSRDVQPLVLRKIIQETVELTHDHRGLWTPKNWVDKQKLASNEDADRVAESEAGDAAGQSDDAPGETDDADPLGDQPADDAEETDQVDAEE